MRDEKDWEEEAVGGGIEVHDPGVNRYSSTFIARRQGKRERDVEKTEEKKERVVGKMK
jgi:hypothetical protein